MVTGDGRVKITDFGIAEATQRAGTQFMTATGTTVGTPTYMAPEQAMAGDIGLVDRPVLGRRAWPTSSSSGTCRSTTPRRRW